MPRFSGVPIVWRVVLAPLLLLAMTAGLIWWIDGNTERSLTVLAGGGQESLQSIEKIYAASAARLRDVDELVATVYRAHAEAMRHMSLSGSGLSDSKLSEIRVEIAKSLARAKQLAEAGAAARSAVADGAAGPAQPGAPPDMLAQLSDYEKAVTEIGDMAELDRLMAIGLVAPTEQKFEALNRTFLTMQQAQWAAARKDAETINRQSSDTIEGVRARAATARTNGLLVALFVLTVGLGLSLAIGRGIAKPLSSITGAMTRLAGGDVAIGIPAAGRGDEVGQMARALLVFKDRMIKEQELAATLAVERRRAEAEKRTALATMAATIEAETGAALEQIRHRAAALTATADEMSSSAGRTGAAARTAASAAAQALANAQSVASAAEQLTASIREIGGQVTQSSSVVGRAVAAGGETRATIETLNQKVDQIGAVADMIGEIAARTDLLALNATIEAARAGDAGKGFAVVASEVKQLAAQTARSTQEIAQHIDKVRLATGASVSAVARIERTIGAIDAITGSIAAAIEQQGAATAEIARNMTETAGAANTMTTRTAEVSAEASDTGRRAADVRGDATGLTEAMEELRHLVIRVVRTSMTEIDLGADKPGHSEASVRSVADGLNLGRTARFGG